MSGVRIISLYSGSTGNSFLITSPVGTLLIDAGKNAKQLCAALASVGVSPDEIGAILVTHEHNDHISALPVFLKKHPVPVHIPYGCAYKLLCESAVAPHLCMHPPIHTEEICGMQVTSFPTPHDSRASVGYRITMDGEVPTSVAYATDIGHVTDEIMQNLLGCESVVLESNHDPDMLMDGPYPYDLKLRISGKKGHLPNEECAAVAAQLYARGTKNILLAHLSEQNNTPRLAFHETFCAIGDKDFNLRVADPVHVSWLVP
jgi:phosphoribosyl 1,2-cyclic phosphodiesterase